METMIRIFAAAFCGAQQTAVDAPNDGETAALCAALRALHGGARFLKDGLLHVHPVKYRPVTESFRLPMLTDGQFLFLSGVAAVLGISFAADTVDPPLSPEEIVAARRTVSGGSSLWIRPTPSGRGYCCGMALPPRTFTLRPRTPEPFAAGLLIGAALAVRDASFVFSCCEPSPTHLLCREILAGYGVRTEDLADGWRIRSRREALPAIPPKERRRFKYWIPWRRRRRK